MIHASRAMTAARVADYFRREYTLGDYYTGDRAAGVGTWQGRGAERLGLAGPVAAADFDALLAGRSPRDGGQLVAPETASGEHRAGWDFEVSPDKSVSVVALVGGDERVVAAHLAAARRAFDLLEDHAQVKDRGREAVPSRNLVIARFDHDASRALDPHLHSHHVVMNLTERAAGEWRALEPLGMYRAQRLATAAYQTELGRELQVLGYEVAANAQGFVRIIGVPEAVVAHFSKRRRQILAEAERRRAAGLPVDLQRIALLTRAPKDRDIDPAALRSSWRADTDRLGLDLDALRRAADHRLAAGLPRPELDPPAQARASVAWAIDHLSERQAAFRHLDLETSALRHAAARGPGLDDIRAALASHPDLIPGRDGHVTTVAALRLEQANLARLRAGLLPSAPPILAHPYDPGPAPEAGPALGADQLRVVRHILESRAQVLGVEGKPGTGKTFTLETVRGQAERAGWTVRGFAVTTGAVTQLRQVGIDADTLKSLAAHPPAAPLPRQLWIVDEASLLSNRDASTALEGAHRAGARLVLVGDRGQHHAVEAGAPWRAFQTAGLRPVQLDLIRRQRHTDLLAAVRLSAAGRAADAIRHLDARGHVVEIASARERHAAMVKEFAARPDGSLMIAPSRAERRDLNFLARRALVEAGRVAAGPEHTAAVEVAVSKGLTGAERADVRHYQVGDVVTYVRPAPRHGLRAGDSARVVAVDAGRSNTTRAACAAATSGASKPATSPPATACNSAAPTAPTPFRTAPPPACARSPRPATSPSSSTAPAAAGSPSTPAAGRCRSTTPTRSPPTPPRARPSAASSPPSTPATAPSWSIASRPTSPSPAPPITSPSTPTTAPRCPPRSTARRGRPPLSKSSPPKGAAPMPLRRQPTTPSEAPGEPPEPGDPPAPHPPNPFEPAAPPPTVPLPAPSRDPEPPPSPAQLRAAAQELAQAAERTERSAHEILGRAHTLCATLAKSLAASERRSARDGLSLILTGTLLCGVSALLSTLVTLAELEPHLSVLDLLRILLRAG
jgi:conjugative relaxase-like TrwC/TraI family protein